MARLKVSQVFLLVAWATVLTATIPHAVMGEPIRPMPLGHLTWALSIVVLVVMWNRRKACPEDRERPLGERLRLYAPVLAGAGTAMVVGLLGGTLRLDPWSLVATTLLVLVPIGLGKSGGVALGALSLTVVGFYGGTVGRATPAPPAPWWADASNRHHPDYNPNANLDPVEMGQRQFVLDYARELFDPGPHEVWQQHPTERIRRTVGSDGSMVQDTLPVAIEVLPQRDAWRIHSIVYAPASVGSGRVGRVVARLVVSNDSLGRAIAGLTAGEYYVWIDNLDPVEPIGPQTVRAVFVPSDSMQTVVTRRIPYRRHAEWNEFGEVPLAKRLKQRVFPSTIPPHERGSWFSTGETDDAWIPCSMNAQCRLFEGDR